MLYKLFIRPILFCFDPERAHHLGLGFLRLVSRFALLRGVVRCLFGLRTRSLEQMLWGLRFPSPVGLAAGFDKNALVVPALASMGFGFLEVGAVSSEARPGNPGPRIHRLKRNRGLINRMGLPNDGAEVIAERLKALGPQEVPVFANIVKTSDLEGDTATMTADYVRTLRCVYPHVDGITVNVSCPATPSLKSLGRRESMYQLLHAIRDTARELDNDATAKPILLKVSPDIDGVEKEVIVDACRDGLLDGLVLTNTSTARPSTLDTIEAAVQEEGGLSGKPLFDIALAFVRDFAAATDGCVPLVAVGGIFGMADALKMLTAGASLVEVYTGYIYEGPSLPSRLAAELEAAGWRPETSAPGP